ncbi:hypothetical protein MIND_01263700 [Mycena indigotica]|uniref:Uncharacterized protein n=1 Tax=Mycena indigotica TaxID=2126181 RepID=A0A8H6S2N0_9AGAR|nr:uncharacterized protein MIND_01263700 [Mycena indigotica]KAF7291203.1 hypothetical protein MIND_01263700 [Mycena indigotica]
MTPVSSLGLPVGSAAKPWPKCGTLLNVYAPGLANKPLKSFLGRPHSRRSWTSRGLWFTSSTKVAETIAELARVDYASPAAAIGKKEDAGLPLALQLSDILVDEFANDPDDTRRGYHGHRQDRGRRPCVGLAAQRYSRRRIRHSDGITASKPQERATEREPGRSSTRPAGSIGAARRGCAPPPPSRTIMPAWLSGCIRTGDSESQRARAAAAIPPVGGAVPVAVDERSATSAAAADVCPGHA